MAPDILLQTLDDLVLAFGGGLGNKAATHRQLPDGQWKRA
jgi:hypothetical protein